MYSDFDLTYGAFSNIIYVLKQLLPLSNYQGFEKYHD